MLNTLLGKIAGLSDRIGKAFFLPLGFLIIVLALLDFYHFKTITSMGQKHYDLMMQHRFSAPAPDPDIVILDIDEKSLASLAKEYGRWPWPRQIFAEVIEALEAQSAKAVVFDIVFSDLDIQNADSDQYLADVAAQSNITFFPLVRLNEDNDVISELTTRDLTNAFPLSADSEVETIAMIIPFFFKQLDNAHLGLINLHQDPDGIVRRYHNYFSKSDWHVLSMPASIAHEQQASLPTTENFLLNWRGPAFSHQHISFADFYLDISRQNKQRPENEFANKIVIIGSTAPSLFDLKATAIAPVYPGVDIMTTAIDNLVNEDFLIEAKTVLYPTITVTFILGLAIAFYRGISAKTIDIIFALSQIILLATAYLSLNLSNYYLDLSAPVMFGFIYFSIARLHTNLIEQRRKGHPLFSARLTAEKNYAVTLLTIEFDATLDKKLSRKARKIQKQLTRYAIETPGAVYLEQPFGNTGLFGEALENDLYLYWICEQNNQALGQTVQHAYDYAKRAEYALVHNLKNSPDLNVKIFLHVQLLPQKDSGQWEIAIKESICNLLKPGNNTQFSEDSDETIYFSDDLKKLLEVEKQQ
jgi:adenylate cyclase